MNVARLGMGLVDVLVFAGMKDSLPLLLVRRGYHSADAGVVCAQCCHQRRQPRTSCGSIIAKGDIHVEWRIVGEPEMSQCNI